MKELICYDCKAKIGEMEKGKIKTDAILLCGKCNYQRLLEKNSKPPENPFPDIFKDFMPK